MLLNVLMCVYLLGRTCLTSRSGRDCVFLLLKSKQWPGEFCEFLVCPHDALRVRVCPGRVAQGPPWWALNICPYAGHWCPAEVPTGQGAWGGREERKVQHAEVSWWRISLPWRQVGWCSGGQRLCAHGYVTPARLPGCRSAAAYLLNILRFCLFVFWSLCRRKGRVRFVPTVNRSVSCWLIVIPSDVVPVWQTTYFNYRDSLQLRTGYYQFARQARFLKCLYHENLSPGTALLNLFLNRPMSYLWIF